ncbi:unnamed protein product [Cyprideis torosa]|uniref:Uncharacterized protein n=1 Tax=Cyprideis torosa TaxID=163714 RepID=A0A7R8W3Z9_9CRUS|nr:unnamed protein product [Cyprideis torosa]CAG0880135.1 unnamed protein product [Cyprideis torosa]
MATGYSVLELGAAVPVHAHWCQMFLAVRCYISTLFNRLGSVSTLLLLFCTVGAEELSDVVEGEEATLECRFGASYKPQQTSLYWIRTNKEGTDNVAIQDTLLEEHYRVTYRPEQGRYDLHIRGAFYERDNGKFDCRVKEVGTGKDLYTRSFYLTVLIAPGLPVISPGYPLAVEGNTVELTCSSTGGSPDPKIEWYSGTSQKPLPSTLQLGHGKDKPTTSILSFVVKKEDDASTLRCVVWNRALPESQTLENTVSLSVHYFPRVTVGPSSPLLVEEGGTVRLDCSVDAKPAVSGVRWIHDGRSLDRGTSLVLERISRSEAGIYTCQADNGLGQLGQGSLELLVLFGPVVEVDGNTEVQEGDTLDLRCQVDSEPKAASVEWLKEGNSSFRHSGPQLRIQNIGHGEAGRYRCQAFVSMQPSSSRVAVERSANRTVDVNVIHSPGQAQVSVAEGTAVAGKPATLKCQADPPGYPKPIYQWWRGDRASTPSMGKELLIPQASAESEGEYFCQAHNALGEGAMGSILLEVAQPPLIEDSLPPTIIKQIQETGLFLNCSATGKPKPRVTWLKDGVTLPADNPYYEFSELEVPLHPRSHFSITSKLYFRGRGRDGQRLRAEDRGHYTCRFENDVGSQESNMVLRMRRFDPVKASSSRGSTSDAFLLAAFCRSRAVVGAIAYVIPVVQERILNSVAVGTYAIRFQVGGANDARDVLRQILVIQANWGRSWQIQSQTTTALRLPEYRDEGRIGVRLATAVNWDAPIFPPQFRKVAGEIGERVLVSCRAWAFPRPVFSWYFRGEEIRPDGQNIQSNSTAYPGDEHGAVLMIRSLSSEHYGQYTCRAENELGSEDMAIQLQEKGAPDPPPSAPVALAKGASWILLGWEPGFHGGLVETRHFVKALSADSERIFDCHFNNPCNITGLDQQTSYSFKIQASNDLGKSQYSTSATISTLLNSNQLPKPGRLLFGRQARTASFNVARASIPLVAIVDVKLEGGSWQQYQSLDVLAKHMDVAVDGEDMIEDLRIRICLKENTSACSENVHAQFVDTLPSYLLETQGAFPLKYLVVIVACLVSVALAVLIVGWCCCRRKSSAKAKGLPLPTETTPVVRPNLVPSTDPPPPYYSSNGEKGGTYDSAPGNHIYGTYAPYQAQHDGLHPNRAFVDQCSTNSNQGGSVNSQDSLWKPHAEDGSYRHFDTVANGPELGGFEDYAQYPPSNISQHATEEFSREGHGPSMSYHTMNGGAGQAELYSHHLQPEHSRTGAGEESVESGYSTPNSRNRRVIREIIV